MQLRHKGGAAIFRAADRAAEVIVMSREQIKAEVNEIRIRSRIIALRRLADDTVGAVQRGEDPLIYDEPRVVNFRPRPRQIIIFRNRRTRYAGILVRQAITMIWR